MGIPDYLTCLGRNLNEGQEATELDMEQLTGSKLEKERDDLLYCHPIYLTPFYLFIYLFKLVGS